MTQMLPSLPYKNVMITGTAGFIASHLAKFLVRKYPQTQFYGIDKMSYCSDVERMAEYIDDANFTFIPVDCCNADSISAILKLYNIDCIIHLAAYTAVDMSFNDSVVYSKNNVVGTHVLLECARQYGKIKRFMHMSTDEVYGPTESPADEQTLFAPTNPYAATKAAAEMICQSYIRSYGMPIVITRANNIYGPFQHNEKVIPKFMTQMLNCEPITIHGDGNVVRNFLYIDSFCAAYDKVIHDGIEHEIYNIGTDFEISIKDLAYKMKYEMRHNQWIYNKLTDKQKQWINQPDDTVIVHIADRIFNDTRYALNIEKIRALGWDDQYNFDVYLAEVMLDHIRRVQPVNEA